MPPTEQSTVASVAEVVEVAPAPAELRLEHEAARRILEHTTTTTVEQQPAPTAETIRPAEPPASQPEVRISQPEVQPVPVAERYGMPDDAIHAALIEVMQRAEQPALAAEPGIEAPEEAIGAPELPPVVAEASIDEPASADTYLEDDDAFADLITALYSPEEADKLGLAGDDESAAAGPTAPAELPPAPAAVQELDAHISEQLDSLEPAQAETLRATLAETMEQADALAGFLREARESGEELTQEQREELAGLESQLINHCRELLRSLDLEPDEETLQAFARHLVLVHSYERGRLLVGDSGLYEEGTHESKYFGAHAWHQLLRFLRAKLSPQRVLGRYALAGHLAADASTA